MSEAQHVVCPHCHTQNRLPAARLGDDPKCGRCHQALFDGHPVELNATAFDKHLRGSDLPLLVDFWAPWCGPCVSMAPQYEKAAKTLEPQFRVAKVNTEVEQSIGARFGIRSIPTLKLFHKGREVASKSGAMDAGGITRWAKSVSGEQ